MVQHTHVVNYDFKKLLILFFDLCLIKKGPRDVPESSVLLKAVFFAYFLAGAILLSSANELLVAAIKAFIETVLVGLFMYLLVSFFSVPNRFNQSISAVYGSGAIITIISAPFIFGMKDLVQNQQQTGLSGLLVFLIVCWGFIVMANIIRETIQKSLSVSLLLTFCYFYLSYQSISLFYPIEAV